MRFRPLICACSVGTMPAISYACVKLTQHKNWRPGFQYYSSFANVSELESCLPNIIKHKTNCKIRSLREFQRIAIATNLVCIRGVRFSCQADDGDDERMELRSSLSSCNSISNIASAR